MSLQERENQYDESDITKYVNKILMAMLFEDKIVRQHIHTVDQMTEVISCIKLYGTYDRERMVQMREAALSVIMAITLFGSSANVFPAKTLKIIEMWTRQAQRPTQSIEEQFDVICCTYSVGLRYLGNAMRSIAMERIDAERLESEAEMEGTAEVEVEVKIEAEDESGVKAVVDNEVGVKAADDNNDEVNPIEPEVKAEEHKREVLCSADADINGEEEEEKRDLSEPVIITKAEDNGDSDRRQTVEKKMNTTIEMEEKKSGRQEKKQCYCCGKIGHTKNVCYNRQRACTHCHRNGHTKSTCWRRTATCYCCGKRGISNPNANIGRRNAQLVGR